MRREVDTTSGELLYTLHERIAHIHISNPPLKIDTGGLSIVQMICMILSLIHI